MKQPPLGLMIAITYKQARRFISSVEHQSVRGVDLFEIVALRAKILQVLAGLIELEDVVAGVAVGKENVAVGCDFHGRRIECLGFEAGFLGERQLQDDLAGIGIELYSFGIA